MIRFFWKSCLALLLPASFALLASAQPACTPVTEIDPDDPRIALVIAQTNYASPVLSDVASARAEADLIANALCQTGFKVLRHSDLTKPELVDAIAGFRVQVDNAGPAAIGFVYYTGHGAQNTNNGHSYLLGTETTLNAPSDVTVHGVDMEQLSHELHAAGARAMILVFDACRNAPVSGDKGNVKGIGFFAPPPGLLVAYSAYLGQLAREGLYAPELAAEIVRPGQTVETLFSSVTHRVVARSMQMDTACANPDLCGPQRPFLALNMYEPIYLAGTTGPAPPPVAVPLPSGSPLARAATPAPASLSATETTLFKLAQDAHEQAARVLEESRIAESRAREAEYYLSSRNEGCRNGVYKGSCEDETGAYYGISTYGGASQGESFIGRFRNGKREVGLFIFPYIADQPNRLATYEGQYIPDSINGAGNLAGLATVTYQDRSVYSGQFAGGGVHGYAICTLPDGTTIHGRWDKGILKQSIATSPGGVRLATVPAACGGH